MRIFSLRLRISRNDSEDPSIAYNTFTRFENAILKKLVEGGVVKQRKNAQIHALSRWGLNLEPRMRMRWSQNHDRNPENRLQICAHESKNPWKRLWIFFNLKFKLSKLGKQTRKFPWVKPRKILKLILEIFRVVEFRRPSECAQSCVQRNQDLQF